MSANAAIDSHHHLWPSSVIGRQDWRPADDDAIDRAFETAEFAELRRSTGVDGSVLMQSVDDADENDRLFAYAAADPGIVGVVGWAPLNRPVEARGVIDALLSSNGDVAGAERLSGVRCLIGRDDIDWALEPEGLALFRSIAAAGLAWDVVPITAEQRRTVARLAEQVPALRIVIDHLGAPPLDGGWDAWCSALGDIAQADNAAIKLSVGVAVLSAMPRWDRGFVATAFGHALDVFGPERAMLGSNWPVVLLRTEYGSAWSDADAAVAGLLDGDDLRRVRGGTASDWYGLDLPAAGPVSPQERQEQL
ncbi:amidohydrolase family protein [Amnibacterium flavum]|uniref:Amidohydrolase-related domain-containing protein n=1 Tax=Amnibacterium flavum TaxID=2173173 RepID=A0A2V1HU50_9MICO|nr:amidohydrolase family protein [Amnibacterium flavum]PVZ94490.1 hypothetical protein DDQ50_12355 [Amnibacterium flavum]